MPILAIPHPHHTHNRAPHCKLSAGPSLSAFCSGATPFVPQTPVLPTGKETLQDATRLRFVHSNSSTSKKCQGNRSSDHYPFIHNLATPARDRLNDKKDLPISQLMIGQPGLELHVPRCTAPKPGTASLKHGQSETEAGCIAFWDL